jgi:hypothetical protein
MKGAPQMGIFRLVPPSRASRAIQALAFVCTLVACALSASAARADTLINFDNLPDNTAVNTQYVAEGVLFDGVTGFPGTGAHISAGEVTAHSGSNVLMNTAFAQEFAGGPVTFTFTTPQSRVQLFAGYVAFAGDPVTRQGTMQVFDSSGKVVAVDGPKTVTGGSASTFFSVSSTSANIASVSVDMGQVDTVIDDLQFGGGGSVTPPPSAPVVTITAPVGTTDFVDNPFQLTGTVAGQGLLTNVQVVMQLQTPPPTPGVPTVNNGIIPLTLSANGGTFDSASAGSTAGFGKLLMGTYLVTVTATNVAGATGTASTTFTNLPQAVGADASENLFGAFQFAETAEGGCQIASFRSGSVAYFPATGRVIKVPVAIATKWFSVQDYTILRGDGRLGCPLGIDVPASFGPTSNGTVFFLDVQDFVRGRIYAPEAGAATYTPKVFVDAITTMSTMGSGPLVFLNDALGIQEVGVPPSDPTTDLSGEEPTILFQQFARFGNPSSVANTLEIRGRNPKLYVERVGGSMLDFTTAMGHTPQPPQGSTFDPTPTVWESYDCAFHDQISDPSFGEYTCQVVRPQVRAVSPQSHVPIYTDANQVDNHDAYCPDSPTSIAVGGAVGFQPLSWSAVPLKADLTAEPSVADFTDVLTKGWVMSSQRSNEDLPSVHDHMHCSTTGDAEDVGITAGGCVVGGVAGCFSLGPLGCIVGTAVGCTLGHDAGKQVAGNDCWSDWGLHVRPLALAAPDPNLNLLRLPANVVGTPPFWNLLSVTADPAFDGQVPMGDMEIEWEADWQNPWTNLADNHPPRPGTLIYLNGRWILDCAHPPFHSEIHPPNTFMAIEMAQPPAGTQGPVTRSQIWSNEFYEGHPFAVTVWPPPRPSADAQLSATYLTFGAPPHGIVNNPNGSISFSFTNEIVGQLGGALSAQASTVTSDFAPDGISASFTGPSGNHTVKESGQAIFPADHPDSANGAVGSFMANWYVGWSQQ